MKRRILLILCVAWLSCHLSSCAPVTDNVPRDRLANFFSQIKPPRGNADMHYMLAIYYQQLGKHVDAIEEFQKTVTISPANFQAYNGMGISYDMLGDFVSAIHSYERALKVDPSSGHTYNNLGYSFLMQGRIEDAVGAFEKAISIQSGIKCFHNNLGAAYALNYQYDLALAEFEKGGNTAQAHKNIARLLFQQGFTLEAESHLSAALALNSSIDQVLSDLSSCDNQLRTANESGYATLLPCTDLEIEVCNGNGVKNMARSIKRYLEDRGFKVVRVTNADHFHHEKDRIYYCGNAQAVKLLTKEMPGNWISKTVTGLGKPGIKMKVLIGKELIPYRKIFEGDMS